MDFVAGGSIQTVFGFAFVTLFLSDSTGNAYIILSLVIRKRPHDYMKILNSHFPGSKKERMRHVIVVMPEQPIKQKLNQRISSYVLLNKNNLGSLQAFNK